MLKNLKQNTKGFTLLEVLLVIAIIAILAGIVIIAINPGKQLADSRDSQREADVSTILNAVYQYSIDNDGALPGPDAIPTEAANEDEICANATCAGGELDLSELLSDETYIVSFPQDPQDASGDGTGYYIYRTANGRITVTAPGAENSTIEVTR